MELVRSKDVIQIVNMFLAWMEAVLLLAADNGTIQFYFYQV